MEVYLNVAETGIGTYGVNAGAQRYFGHDASAMSATEAARIAAILPLPKKRGAIAPKGFTRRYGNTIAARIGVVGRDGLDACVYKGAAPPPAKAPPKVTAKPRPLPGEEYETANPPPAPPAEDNAVEALPPADAPVLNQAAPSPPPPPEPLNSTEREPAEQVPPPSNGV
jgi:monofunctional biosynthetic peptidoglycan transglycosylase